MKRIINYSIALVALFAIASPAIAQKSVILQHNGTASSHTSISLALIAAADGDTIYVSGGIFAESMTVSKKLTIYGAGHYPDSTMATLPTKVTGTVTINGTAGGGSMEGLYTGDITFNAALSGYTISRCNTGYIRFITASFDNILISENVVRNYIDMGNKVDNIIIEKCILGNRLINFNLTALTIKNNVFIHNPGVGSRLLESIYGAIIINNVFTYISNTFINNALTDNTFLNNLFVYAQPGLDPSNLTGVDASVIFLNFSSAVFDYDQDYHLADGSPAINFGTDGTDAGIYGTAVPYKESAVPSNPHISVAEIADETDGAGQLQITIRVTGQNR